MRIAPLPVLAAFLLPTLSLADAPDAYRGERSDEALVSAYGRVKGGGGSRGTTIRTDRGGSTIRTDKGGSGSNTGGGTTTGVTNLYVSPQGNDAWSGTAAAANAAKTDGPVATLTRARDLVRAMKQSNKIGAKGVVVNVLPGSYRLTASFVLNANDSGTEAAPVIYRGTQPGSVELVGGVELKTWRAVSNNAVSSRLQASVRSKVLEADLSSLATADFGSRQRIGFYGAQTPSVAELFFEGEPMRVAQWPNAGWARTVAAPKGSGWSFGYTGDRPASWSDENDPWVHGFFFWDWADFYERLSDCDSARRLLRTEATPNYGFQAGARYVFCNVLEELDSPGEYYVDSARKKVYFLRPTSAADGRTVVSTLGAPLIQVDKASNIQFESLSLRFSRGTGMLLNGCVNVAVNGCSVTGMGLHGIEAVNASRVTIKSSDVSDIGGAGIVMNGGDRKTLTSGANVIENCHVAAVGRIVATSEPAVDLGGVGTAIRNCSIHDVPQMAVTLRGNNHVIEANEIYNTCLETSDSGAIYMGRDFSEQGNAIRSNYFHDIVQSVEKNPSPGNGNTYDIKVVCLDDFASGTTIYGNIFQRVDVGVLIGGGRDNTVQNNAFLDCDRAVSLDARGQAGSSAAITNPNGELMTRLRNSAYLSAPYRAAYPKLATILSDNPAVPKRNVLQSNVCYVGRWIWTDGVYSAALNPERNSVVGVDPGFTNLAGLVLTPRTKSAAAKAGFKALSAKTCGLKVDAYRKTLPKRGAEPAL